MLNLFTTSPRLLSTLLQRSKMPAFTLYGALGSTNTDRVRLTLAEGGITDYDFVLINLQKGEQKVGEPFLMGTWSTTLPVIYLRKPKISQH